MSRRRRIALVLPWSLATLATVGCFVHRTDISPAPAEAPPPTADLESRIERAERLRAEARNREEAEVALRAWDEILEVRPDHRRSLVAASTLELLLGAGYSDSCDQREAAYRKALRRVEQSMATRPAFRARLERGQPVWEAVDALGLEDMQAMNLWSTAIFYQYRDCLSSVGKVLNLRWIRRARRVMERMTALDPDWNSGALHFAWGIYYLALPEVAGGDRERSATELATAIELGPDWLLFRWGRGRYFALEAGDREGFRSDLEWVVAQDLRTAGGPPEWNVYLQREARELLADIDSYFPSSQEAP